MSDTERSDEEIVSEVLGGKREAFAVLVRRNQDRVFSLGIRFFHNREDARDFTQEVFVRTFERLAGFRGEAKFSTWLLKVAYYLGISSTRRRRPPSSLPEDFEPLDPGLNPEEQELARAARTAVAKAVEELPERYRICVDLYFSMEMTYEDISVVTGTPEGTIKSNVFRAKKILRETLAGTAAEGYHGL